MIDRVDKLGDVAENLYENFIRINGNEKSIR